MPFSFLRFYREVVKPKYKSIKLDEVKRFYDGHYFLSRFSGQKQNLKRKINYQSYSNSNTALTDFQGVTLINLPSGPYHSIFIFY